MNRNYSQEFKESMIQKVFLNPDRTVVSFAKTTGVPASTITTWVSKYKKNNGEIMGLRKKRSNWSAERKFESVLQTSLMSEAEKSAYCREYGIYTDDLKQWVKDCISGCRQSPDKEYVKKFKHKELELKKKTIELEKELKRKNQALAETAALLVLKKKVQEIWGE